MLTPSERDLPPIPGSKAIAPPKPQFLALEYGRDAARWLRENLGQRRGPLAVATVGEGCFVTGAVGYGGP
jgi:hypothetical protein